MDAFGINESFTRRVSPRVAGVASIPSPTDAAPRTRSISRAIRERGRKRQISPHSEVEDGGDQNIDSGGEQNKGEQNDDDEDDHVEEEDGDEGDGNRCDDEDCNPHELLVKLSVDPVRVPALQKFHKDWDMFKQYLTEYSQLTHQVIVVFEVMKAEEKNIRLSKRKKSKELEIIPLHLNPYSRVYRCTHGPKPKNRGKGQRPRRFIRHTNCPFRFRVQWTKPTVGDWVLEVTPSVSFHNHVIGAESYGTYPVSRGIHDENAISRAKEMVCDGVRRAVIYDRMPGMGQNVFKTDIDNFVSVHQARASHRDEDAALTRAIETFEKENPDGALTVDETSRGETGVISITTPHMRSMFERFGELLLVDCTHKTNRLNYQLCAFMVMDEYGAGQVVQQSLLETNADWHMERAVLHLKRVSSESWKRVRVIVVDKDLNEVRVLKRMFSAEGEEEVRILLCHFHVVKYLN